MMSDCAGDLGRFGFDQIFFSRLRFEVLMAMNLSTVNLPKLVVLSLREVVRTRAFVRA